MDPRVAKLKTVEDCANFEVNAKAKGEIKLALSARRRAVQIRANAIVASSLVERECLQAVYAYEEALSYGKGRRRPAVRTWQMIKRHGIVPAVERVVTKRAESTGFTALAEIDLLDLAFEAVVLRYPKEFSEQAVNLSREHLAEAVSKTSKHSRKLREPTGPLHVGKRPLAAPEDAPPRDGVTAGRMLKAPPIASPSDVEVG